MRVILLSPNEVSDLYNAVRWARETGQSVRVAVDEEAFKVKIGYGTWSPLLGVMEVDD